MALLEGYLNTNPTSIGGPVLAIVDGTAISAAEEDGTLFTETGKNGSGEISTYTVRQGDTLSSIAKMFNVSVNTIVWTNNIQGGKLTLGQELVILPISGVRHIVKSGDTIASIAKKYNADKNDILSYNGLSADEKLAAGQEIIIPDGELTTAATSGSTGKSSGGSSSGSYSTKSCGAKISRYERLLINPCSLPSHDDYYTRPLAGGIKTQELHGYNAIDIGSPVGTPIMAAAEGTVILSRAGGYNGGYGTYVVISHPNGTQTVYGHMSADLVKVGEEVKQGEVIGKVGMTGHTTGPHLHFEIRGARNPF